MIVLDLQGIEPAQPSVTSSLRSPRGALPAKAKPEEKLLQLVSMLSSTMIYAQDSSFDKLINIVEPVVKFSNVLQKELGVGTGPMSTMSESGPMSSRSANTSLLDITQSISSEVTDLFCPHLIAVSADFTPSDETATRRQAIRKHFENTLKPMPGVSSEAMRKNKVVECIKTLFSHSDCFALPPSHASDYSSASSNLIAQLKRIFQPKKV